MTQELKSSTNYYAVTGIAGSLDAPYFIFREVTRPGRYWLERWSKSRRTWETDMSLASYTLNGENGTEPISKARAQTVIGRAIKNP